MKMKKKTQCIVLYRLCSIPLIIVKRHRECETSYFCSIIEGHSKKSRQITYLYHYYFKS